MGTKKVNKVVNAGVHASIGRDFQKYCALYIFLEKYNSIKDRRYFIILEHYDDVVFGYLDGNKKLEKIETFQAKKSGNEWKVSQLYEIVKKILANGLLVRQDKIEKADTYTQNQFFVSNNTIALRVRENKKYYGCLVNESDCEVKFSDLDIKVQEDIKAKLLSDFSCIKEEIDELINLSFRYIDLSRKNSSQKEQLQGMFKSFFGNQVIDYSAALDTLLEYFRKTETTLNQKNAARLTDSSKRIESDEINKVLDILTTKKKAYELWKKKSDTISTAMQISLWDQRLFKLNFENSFDMFKDLHEVEHKRIYNYVLSKKELLKTFYSDEDCLRELNADFSNNHNTQLTDLQLKAAIYAAYIEVKEQV